MHWIHADSIELNEVLNGMVSPDEYGYARYERRILKEFRVDPVDDYFPMYKEKKDHYNYLYLDPRVLCMIDGCSGEPEQEELFKFYKFVKSVFYIGKGRSNRAIAHLRETRKKLDRHIIDVSISTSRHYSNLLYYLSTKKHKYLPYVSF